MRSSHYLRQMLRESRGSRGRLAFFLACLAVGVAAVVAVAGLTTSVDAGIRREARQLLAADLSLEARRPLPPEAEAFLDARVDLERAQIKELVTMLTTPGEGGQPGRSLLVELKAVSGPYPFYGDLELEPPLPLGELLGGDSAIVAPDLLPRLGIAVGDSISIGGRGYKVTAAVRSEPDRGSGAFTLGPRVFVSMEGLARTELERFGSRVSHRTLIRLPEDASLEELAARLRRLAGDPPRFRVETYAEAQPALREGLRRVDRFLGLVALLSLLLGGVGVAQTTRAWLDGRTDAMAVLRSLGYRPREVFLLYQGQALALGCAGSLVGAALGLAAQRAIPALLGDLLPTTLELRLWQPAAVLRGLGLGLGTALLFSLSPLIAVRRVPPLRVLRKEVEPIPPSRWSRAATGLALVLGVWLAATAQARSALLGLQFTLGAGAAAALLGLASLALVWGAGRLPRRRGRMWLRHGLAALGRPGAGTVGAVVALGMGVLLLLAVAQVQRTLSGELTPPEGRQIPSAFFLDIQPDQWPGVRELLLERGTTDLSSVPVVTARLRKIDRRPVGELAAEPGAGRDRRWALTREQRLTYLERLPEDNRIVAGALWSDPDRLEVSVEEEFAGELGVGLGGELEFDLQGVPVVLIVTSLRAVDWRTFDINFFLVVEPAALADAPGYRLATARLPEGREQEIQDALAARYPNVTLLDIRSVLEQVRGVLDRLAAGVQFIGAFTILAGIAILAGAVSAGALRRAREVALLKTLGMTRAGVASMFAVEYALVGLVAGGIGASGGLLLAWAVVTRGLQLAWAPDLAAALLAMAASVMLTAATGVLAAGPALQRKPAEVLRGE